ncbi:hypothetical protein V7S43_009908 [Phytophthora oleae]|uniref:Uncharacterized protein n=1 Tax=Phytophthora oleae TaxID=2107226 RepID=A0ABD3FEB3_9STRA
MALTKTAEKIDPPADAVATDPKEVAANKDGDDDDKKEQLSWGAGGLGGWGAGGWGLGGWGGWGGWASGPTASDSCACASKAFNRQPKLAYYIPQVSTNTYTGIGIYKPIPAFTKP